MCQMGHKELEVVVMKNGQEIVQRQETLDDPVPVLVPILDLICNADSYLESKKVSPEQVIDGMWNSFPLYNLCEDKLEDIIMHMHNEFEKNNQVSIPCQLLCLAALNTTDIYCNKRHISNFRSRHVKVNIEDNMITLSTGRWGYANRILKQKGYIGRWGNRGSNRWIRTDKDYDEKDFW